MLNEKTLEDGLLQSITIKLPPCVLNKMEEIAILELRTLEKELEYVICEFAERFMPHNIVDPVKVDGIVTKLPGRKE